MAFGLSTLAQTSEKFAAAEEAVQTQEQPAPSVTAEATNIEPVQETIPTEAAPVAEQTPTEQPVQEENVSSFQLGFGDEQAQQPTEEKPTAPTFNWKDELKKLDRAEVLKEFGLSEFALEMDNHIKGGGQPIDYLNAKAVDYNKVSDEELVKSDYKKQFPNLTGEEINRLFNRKYGVAEDMLDDEKEDRLIMLKADGHTKRQAAIQEQQKFKISNTPIPERDEAYERWKEQQATQPAMVEKIKTFYETHDATKTLNESKRVAISLGDGMSYNFSVEHPEYLTRLYTDGGETWNKVTSTKSGEPDVAKQHLIGLFSFNPQQFSQAIFNYGMQMGRKKMVEEGQNAQRPQQKVMPPEMNGQASYSTGRYSDKARN